MAREVDRVFRFQGRLYIPCNTTPLSAGPFFAASANSVEQHVVLSPEFLLYRHLELRPDRTGPAAAWVRGNSMEDYGVLDGDLAIFQRYDFDYLQHNRIVVVERLGEEEGFGAWALKRFVVKRPRSSQQSEYGDEIDWNEPEIVLYSYNPRVPLSQLDPSGQYRVRGVFLRSMRRDDVTTIDSDEIRRLAQDEE